MNNTTPTPYSFTTTHQIAMSRDNILAAIPFITDDEHRAELTASAERLTAELDRRASIDDAPVEIAYRIPGKGNFKRRTFKTAAAAEAFTTKLREREGDDVEIRWAS